MVEDKGARPYLADAELRRLTDDDRLCYVSGAILLEGRLTGYMLKELPAFPEDSGWRFFAGGETAEILRAPGSGFLPINTMCNYDRDILPLLDGPVGAAYVRRAAGLTPLDGIAREIDDQTKGDSTPVGITQGGIPPGDNIQGGKKSGHAEIGGGGERQKARPRRVYGTKRAISRPISGKKAKIQTREKQRKAKEIGGK